MPKHRPISKPRGPQKIKTVPKPSTEEINKVLGPARDARRARAALGLPARLMPPGPTPETVKSVLARTGLELAELEQLAKKYRADLCKLGDERMRKGREQSTQLQAFLDLEIAARRKAAENLSELLPAAQYQVLDRPSGILTTGGLQLDHARIQSYGSWAKVRHQLKTADSTIRELIFSYFWQNSTNKDMVITADGYIILNGLAKAEDTTGFWLVDHYHTTLTVAVQLEVFHWPVSSQQDPHVSSFTETAVYLDAYGPGGWPLSLGAILPRNVFRGFDLRVEDLLVKSSEARVFDVALTITADIGDGDIDVDFSTNDFQVTSPMVQIAITS
jgi:hypothetical protein